MTVTLNLNPEVEKSLFALAQARGLSLTEYLQEIAVREATHFPALAATSGEDRARALLDWCGASRKAIPLAV